MIYLIVSFNPVKHRYLRILNTEALMSLNRYKAFLSQNYISESHFDTVVTHPNVPVNIGILHMAS